MQRRRFVATLGALTATGLAGCGNDDPASNTDTPTQTPTPTDDGEGATSPFPDEIKTLLLEEEDFPDEEWTLVKADNPQTGWFTHELNRRDDDERLHAMFSDVWLHEDRESATEDYESRKSDYVEYRDTTALDIGDDCVGWVDGIAVALFYEGDTIGQIEYQIYDDGELAGATVDHARTYAEVMNGKW